ncbi:MAG: hypothetical protein R2741_15300 [Methanolobus sp.]
MFNKGGKFNLELKETIDDYIQSNLSARINEQSDPDYQRTADSINFLLEEMSVLKAEVQSCKKDDHEAECDYLLNEVSGLINAATEGNLKQRANTDNFSEPSKKVLEGINAILDAVVKPLNVSAMYIDRISKGDIPEKITQDYKGDFNEIKNNLNQCIDSINLLVEDSLTLANAGVAGLLDTRADATKHAGDFRKVVEGVNGCLDAVIGPLNVTANA